MNFKKFVNLWLPVVAWCGLIFLVSSLQQLPKLKTTFLDVIIKNLAHFLEYAVLFFLSQRALKEKQNKYFFAFIFSSLYAFTDEFHQSFIPGRDASLIDVGIDIIGVGASWYFLIRRFGGKPDQTCQEVTKLGLEKLEKR